MSDEAKPAAKAKAVAPSEAKVNAVTVVVTGVKAKFPLRITELGGKPLSDGDSFKLSTDVAQRFLEQYNPYLKKEGAIEQGVTLKNVWWEPIKYVEKAAAEPKGKPEDASQALVDQTIGSNKSMQGSAKVKTK